MSFHHLRRALLAGVVSISMLAQHAVAQTAELVVGGSAPAATTLTDQNWQQELAVWQAASSGNTPDEYRAYLRSYPTGKFADIARSRVAAAEAVEAPAPIVAAAPAAPPPAFMPGTPMTEEGLLDRTMRREVQGRLTALGFPTGGADGAFGNQTRTAMSRWQATIGAPVTGYLSYDQFQRLRQDSQGLYETWLNQQQAAARKRVVRRPDRVLEGRVPNNNNGDAAAALALGLIGGALIGGAIAGGGRHHGGGFRGGPGPGRCPPGMPCR
jgi:hypothetical protein